MVRGLFRLVERFRLGACREPPPPVERSSRWVCFANLAKRSDRYDTLPQLPARFGFVRAKLAAEPCATRSIGMHRSREVEDPDRGHGRFHWLRSAKTPGRSLLASFCQVSGRCPLGSFCQVSGRCPVGFVLPIHRPIPVASFGQRPALYDTARLVSPMRCSASALRPCSWAARGRSRQC